MLDTVPPEAYIMATGLVAGAAIGAFNGWRTKKYRKRFGDPNIVSYRAGSAVRECEFGHYRGISRWCPQCTAERELRLKKFKKNCACPQCGWVTMHDWSSISTLQFGSPYMNVDDAPNKIYVVRRCSNCDHKWRQS